MVVSTPKTWLEAHEHCKSLNGELATLMSIEEQNEAMNGQTSSHYWIGLSDRAEEGQWVWADG